MSVVNCGVCGFPLWPALVRIGAVTHAVCDPYDEPETYCRRGCPDDPKCCLKAATFRPIRNVPVGDRL